MIIPFVNLKKQSILEKKTILKAVKQTLKSSNFILGDSNINLEKKISHFKKSKYCALLNSGTDALTLGLHILGIKRGDEVITCSNSFIASAASIVHLGAKPIFVDVKDDQNINPKLIEAKITKKTKAIMPIHLTGRVCDMRAVIKIARKYKLKVIEDAAQSFGSKFNGKMAGTFGDIGCISLHPLKNFNGVGDGGFILTNSLSYYKRICRLRNHGLKDRNYVDEFGFVSRYDTLKTNILSTRFKNIKNVISKRRNNAKLYFKYIDKTNVYIPPETTEEFNTYHTFVIQVKKREQLIKFLRKKNISTAIHYPIPIHLQKAFKRIYNSKIHLPKTIKQSKEILSLPINEHLTIKEIKFVSESINKFYKL